MIGFRTLLYKEVLRFWKVSFQTVAAPLHHADEDVLKIGLRQMQVFDRATSQANPGKQRFNLVESVETKNPVLPVIDCHSAQAFRQTLAIGKAQCQFMPRQTSSRLRVVSSATTRPCLSIAIRPHKASASSR